MFAKNLEITLVLLCEKGDVSSTPSSDIANRFVRCADTANYHAVGKNARNR